MSDKPGGTMPSKALVKKQKGLFDQKKCLNVRQKLGTRSHSLTLTVSHSLTLVILNNFCFHVYAQKSLSHSHTLWLSHSLSLNMLNNFCFHVYFQKSLFIAENCSVFLDISLSLIITLPCEVRVHRAGSSQVSSWSSDKCVKCSKYWCWSLEHTEKPLFSCLCSKVTYVKCHKSNITRQKSNANGDPSDMLNNFWFHVY